MGFQDHNCTKELRGVVAQMQQKMSEMMSQMEEQKLALNEQKREICLLKVSCILFSVSK